MSAALFLGLLESDRRRLEQFSELRVRPDGAATRSILSCGAVPVCFAALQVRSARRNSLALPGSSPSPLCFAALQVGQKRSAFSVKCSMG
ncbi:hypothetical protein DVJ83_05130 [Deinococcus wulumuqiensis]|uniref:Uncharacterized protein n=1 Tax=Deinococcus wulumuqiensis TaxID=980427 RepID=A0A345IG25_9DEIO|nr:hypothetical protein DVJ83_05130 [Deinococcus wulumuqiensis]